MEAQVCFNTSQKLICIAQSYASHLALDNTTQFLCEVQVKPVFPQLSTVIPWSVHHLLVLLAGRQTWVRHSIGPTGALGGWERVKVGFGVCHRGRLSLVTFSLSVDQHQQLTWPNHVICWCWALSVNHPWWNPWSASQYVQYVDKLHGDANFPFQLDLAPSHSVKSTSNQCTDHGITVLNHPENWPDLNPTMNLGCIVKSKV